MVKRKKKPKHRNLLAVLAWFRNSAGAMKNKKKDKKISRRWKHKKENDNET